MGRFNLVILAALILISCGDGSGGRREIIGRGAGGGAGAPPTSAPARNARVELKDQINREFDSAGKLHYLGELINNGEDPACLVKIVINSENASGGLIDSDFTYVNGSTLSINSTETNSCLKSGEVGGFDISTSQESIPAFSSIEISWDADDVSTPEVPSSQVILDGSISELTDFFGDMTLSGSIKNGSAHKVSSVKISFVALKNGKVVNNRIVFVKGSGCDPTNTCLLPGGSGLFEAGFNMPPSEVESYYYKINYSVLDE